MYHVRESLRRVAMTDSSTVCRSTFVVLSESLLCSLCVMQQFEELQFCKQAKDKELAEEIREMVAMTPSRLSCV